MKFDLSILTKSLTLSVVVMSLNASATSYECNSKNFGHKYKVEINQAGSVTALSKTGKVIQTLKNLEVNKRAATYERKKATIYDLFMPDFGMKVAEIIETNSGTKMIMNKTSDRLDMGDLDLDASITCQSNDKAAVLTQPSEVCKSKPEISISDKSVVYTGIGMESKIIKKEVLKDSSSTFKYIVGSLQGTDADLQISTVLASQVKTIAVVYFKDQTSRMAAYIKLKDKSNKVLVRYYVDGSENFKQCR